jgi:hypothetical protein
MVMGPGHPSSGSQGLRRYVTETVGVPAWLPSLVAEAKEVAVRAPASFRHSHGTSQPGGWCDVVLRPCLALARYTYHSAGPLKPRGGS